MTQMNISTKQKQTQGQGKQTCGFHGGGSWGGDRLGGWVSRCKVLYLKGINN